MKLELAPLDLDSANTFIKQHHRHIDPAVGHKFSQAAILNGKIVGVAITGRPVNRNRDDGWTLEVTRLCTDGTRNACSFLYGAAARATFALGYKRIGTYLLQTENGTSLKAAGWRLISQTKGRAWGTTERPRLTKRPPQNRTLWEATP